MSVPPRTIIPPFKESFTDVVNESSNPDNSDHGDWFLSAGGYMSIGKGKAMTNQIDLPPTHRWAIAYKDNPDCEGGERVENIFRLVSRDSSLLNFTLSSRFQITRISMTDSVNRTGDKGLFQMMRYQDSDNLLYVGSRHDGDLVVKTKINGSYTTLAQTKWWPGLWNKTSHPSLMPFGVPFSLKTVLKSVGDVTSITVFVTDPGATVFRQALSVSKSIPALAKPGRIGFRGDFCAWFLDDISLT